MRRFNFLFIGEEYIARFMDGAVIGLLSYASRGACTLTKLDGNTVTCHCQQIELNSALLKSTVCIKLLGDRT